MDQPERLLNHGRPLPPAKTRWKKGQSGNPKGRPKKIDSIASLLKETVMAACPTDPEQRSYAELLVRTLLHLALKGNLTAVKEILNRFDGKVPLPIEMVSQTVRHRTPSYWELDPEERAKSMEGARKAINEIFGDPFDQAGEYVTKAPN